MKPLQVLAALCVLAPLLGVLSVFVLAEAFAGVRWPESVSFERLWSD